jgi:hypothetical protein
MIAELQAQILVLPEAAVVDALAATAAAAAAATAATAATAAQAQAVLNATTLAAPAPVFALAPALVNTATFLDLSTSGGMKHFKGGSEGLNAQAFDFKDDTDLQVFLGLTFSSPSPRSGAGATSSPFRCLTWLPGLLGTGTCSATTV